MEKNSLEETLQDAKLHRQLSSLIVTHLRDSNLYQAASAVASATMTSFNAEAPRNRLLELISKGLAVEKDEMLREVSLSAYDLGTSVASRYGAIPATRTAAVDFGFSSDGKFVATGSSDASIKLFGVSKIKQIMLAEARDGPVRPVIRTFNDHLQPINDLDFHPQNTSVLISGSKGSDHKDTHKVRSVCFHPSGDFLLAGMDHPIPHLYDINTFQCYLSANAPDIDVNGAVNLVRYSATGDMYVTASKDSVIRLWDGVTAKCVRSIPAHGTAEATSANFTKDQRFVLSSGKDSTVKLWEVGTGKLVKQYLGATHTQLRCLAVFNDTEEFVLSIDEPTNEIVILEAMTADKVAKWPSNHVGAFRWLAHSPTEAAFVACGTDRSIRFWKESLSSL